MLYLIRNKDTHLQFISLYSKNGPADDGGMCVCVGGGGGGGGGGVVLPS